MRDCDAYLELQLLSHAPNHDIAFFAPSLQVMAFKKGRLICDLKLGHPQSHFDLASLTKVLFTNTLLMLTLKKNPSFQLNHFLSKHLSIWKNPKPKIKQLLTHTSGLTWWRPYYQQLEGQRTETTRWSSAKSLLANERLKPNKKAVYSDLGYLMLGGLLIEQWQAPLSYLWEQEIARFLAGQLHFRPLAKNKIKNKECAPTGFCEFRQRSLQGEVHDLNCWALGEISTHAGLFGRIEDVADWALRLRHAYYGGTDLLFDRDLLQLFCRRHLPKQQGDWGLGFMKPTQGSASCGPLFSPHSFGHLGFTGTSYWMDPKQDLIVLILSNRTLKGLEPNSLASLRPWIHTWISEFTA